MGSVVCEKASSAWDGMESRCVYGERGREKPRETKRQQQRICCFKNPQMNRDAESLGPGVERWLHSQEQQVQWGTQTYK